MSKHWSRDPKHTVSAIWEQAVARWPDKVFLHFLSDDKKYSYGAFDKLVGQLANGLIVQGVGAGDRVATLLNSNIHSVALLFATAQIGAIYVPINTANKGDFLFNPLDNSGAKICVLESQFTDRINDLESPPAGLEKLFVVGELSPDAGRYPCFEIDALYAVDARKPASSCKPSDIAGIIYTGGTTGPSKGCVLSHNYLANMAIRCIEMCEPQEGDINWTCLPLFHLNALTTTILYAAATGTTAAVTERFSVKGFWGDIERSGATVAMVLGAMIAFIAAQPDTPESERCKGQLRLARGAPFTAELQATWKQRFGPEITGAHVYGLTEASYITMLDYAEAQDAPPGSSGKANLRDFEVMIVDDDFNPLPAGSRGEIVVRPKGPNLMFEVYWGRPAETLAVMGGLWFHTGDIGQFDEQGFFYFVDRKKDYLRRRGENISSFEMESTFMKHPDLAEVAVHAVNSAVTEDDLKVTAVLRPGATLTAEELARWSVDRVPYFAVPRYIEFRDELPKSPVGRVLKHQLRDEGCTADTWDLEQSDVTYSKV